MFVSLFYTFFNILPKLFLLVPILSLDCGESFLSKIDLDSMNSFEPKYFYFDISAITGSTSLIFFFILCFSLMVSSILCIIGFKKLINSLIHMVICIFLVGVIFFAHGLEILGILTLLIYIGAIMIFFLFAILLLLKFFSFKVLTTKQSNTILSVIEWAGSFYIFSTIFALVYSYIAYNDFLMSLNFSFFFNSLEKLTLQLLQLDLVSLYGLQLYTMYSFILLSAGVLLSLVILAALRISKSFDKKKVSKNLGNFKFKRLFCTYTQSFKDTLMLQKISLNNNSVLYLTSRNFSEKKRVNFKNLERVRSPSLSSYVATSNSMLSISTRMTSIFCLLVFVYIFFIAPTQIILMWNISCYSYVEDCILYGIILFPLSVVLHVFFTFYPLNPSSFMDLYDYFKLFLTQYFIFILFFFYGSYLEALCMVYLIVYVIVSAL